MNIRLLSLFLLLAGWFGNLHAAPPPERSRWALENAQTRTYISKVRQDTAQRAVDALVIPIKGSITTSQHYILRRGLKYAMEHDFDLVILDIDTPGGELGTMLKMMEALDQFDGTVVAFVDNEAISAGSFIAIVCDEIYFAPNGIMGAAEAVTGTGEDVSESMKRKIESYLDAKVRSLSGQHRYRAAVQRAMMKPDYELKIDDQLICPKGELLSLTAEEAIRPYGNPPAPLLAEAILPNISELLVTRHGDYDHLVRRLELSWAESVAKWLNQTAPILMGIGMLLLFIEFKTPGFGIFGIGGILMIVLVIAGQYIAGIAGYEPLAVFVLGLVLIAIELFVFPGHLISGLLGIALLLGSLVWGMTDIWPNQGIGDLRPEMFKQAIIEVMLACGLALAVGFALAKVLPHSWFLDKLILKPQDHNPEPDDVVTRAYAGKSLPPLGAKGVAVSTLFPSGEVEINGQRFLARAEIDMIKKGTPVEVVEQRAFQLVVKAIE